MFFSRSLRIIVLSTVLVLPVSPCFAQDARDDAALGVEGGLAADSGGEPERTPKPLPQRGSLSRSLTSGTAGTTVDLPWGDVTGRTETPISGSVSRVGAREWVMKVFNNDSKDTYSVNVQVVQYGSGQRSLKSDSYSYTLKPRQTEERKFIAAVNAVDCELRLLGWKNLTKRREKTEEPKTETPPVPAAAPTRAITPAPAAVPRYLPTVPPLR